jgi:uncharacterized protein YgfB (UPF0149 family)
MNSAARLTLAVYASEKHGCITGTVCFGDLLSTPFYLVG